MISSANSETSGQGAQQGQRCRNKSHMALDQTELVGGLLETNPRAGLDGIPKKELRMVCRPTTKSHATLQLRMRKESTEDLKRYQVLALQFAITDRLLPLMHPNASNGVTAHQYGRLGAGTREPFPIRRLTPVGTPWSGIAKQ